MTRNKFITSTIILIVGGLITKVFGMLIKIITTRYVGTDGIGIYMLILPTFTLFINITQLGFPVAISKLVAEEKKSNKKIIFSVIPVSLALNFCLLVVILLISPLISKLLSDQRTLYPLLSIGFVLPFISLSSIIRGYFFGKQKMIAHMTSHIFEQIMRLILIIILIPILIPKGIEVAISGIVLVNIVSELTSIIILIFFIPKKVKIYKRDLVPDKGIIRDVLNIGVPTTGSRIIGSIGYFLEPIILTFVLLKVGYSSSYIIREYGVINGYVLPMLLIPSFFTQAISSALIPNISKAYANHNLKYVRVKLKQAILISIFIGFIVTTFFIIKPDLLLQLVYNTDEGTNYLKLMAPFFLIYYLQVPMTATLQSIDKAKEAMMGTLVGMIIKIPLLIILSLFKIGLYSLVISSIVNIIIVTYHNFRNIKKALA